MGLSFSVPADLHAELLAHLAASKDEQVAFLFTEPPGTGEVLSVSELYKVPPDGFLDQSPYYLALSDEVRARILGRATELGGCLIEIHSHAHGPAGFSATDLSGFEDWVPHVRWRLAGRPYFALVFVGKSFDALVWEEGDGHPGPLDELVVPGEGSFAPTGITLNRLSSRSHGR
jgi:Prokaryotic homologs of the JAB domain